MNRKTLSVDSFKNRPVRVLGNIGNEGESVTVEVEVPDMGDVNIRTVKDWLKQGGCKTLAEAPFRNGPEGRKVWESAFSNLKKQDMEFHSKTFDLFFDDGSAGPREPRVSVDITKATVTLEDGTIHDDVFYVTFSRSSGNPDDVLIMQRE